MTASHPVFWISGNYYDCRKTWLSLIDRIQSSFQETPNVNRIECGYNPDNIPARFRLGQAADVIMALKTEDMFDSRPRVIHMHGCPPDYAIIHDYLKLADDRNVLVITGPVGYRMPSGRGSRFVDAKRSKFYKTIKGWDNVYDYPEQATSFASASKWIVDVVKECNLHIDKEAADLLVEYKGFNLDTLYCELSKLMVCFLKVKKITVDHVKEICIPVFHRTVWDFIDSLDQGDYDHCIAHLDGFFVVAGDQVGSNFYGDVQALIASVTHHLVFLELVNGRENYSTAVAACEGIQKKLKDGTYKNVYSPQFIRFNLNKPNIQSAMRWNPWKIKSLLCDIYRCALSCRYRSGDREYIKRALKIFVMLACGQVSLSDAALMRGKIEGMLV